MLTDLLPRISCSGAHLCAASFVVLLLTIGSEPAERGGEVQ